MKKKTSAQRVFMVFNYIFIILVCMTCIMPFANLLAISFSSKHAVQSNSVVFWPVEFTVSSYEFALKGGRFLAALWMSVKRVGLGVIVMLVLMILTAYPLSHSKEKFVGRSAYMVFFVFTMIFNGGLIPSYIVVSKLGLLDSIWALILPFSVSVYCMIILMNFIRSLPEEMEEAAMIDGANEFTTLLRVILPLLTPSLATVGLFSIVWHWNDWFYGLIYMKSAFNYPLQTYLQSLLNGFEAMLRSARGDFTQIAAMMSVRTGRAAQLFLGMIPIMLIYPFLQKYFTTGLVLGSVKG